MPAPRAPVARSYRGTSAEERRSARRAQLLAAGLDLLGTDGYQGTTVRAVCARARLTPRYFYESFEDLDALLVAVFDRLVGEASEIVLRAVDETAHDARAKARAAIEGFVRFATDDPRRARVMFVEAVGVEALMRRRSAAMSLFAKVIADRGGEFYGAPADADPVLELTASLLAGGLTELLVTWLDGRIAISREELVDDVTELFVATGEGAVAIARRRAAQTGHLAAGATDPR